MVTLIQNAIRIVEDDIYLVSTTEDDRPAHKLSDGTLIAISGGLSWALRVPIEAFVRLLDAGKVEEWSLTSEDPLEVRARKTLYPTKRGWRLGKDILSGEYGDWDCNPAYIMAATLHSEGLDYDPEVVKQLAAIGDQLVSSDEEASLNSFTIKPI